MWQRSGLSALPQDAQTRPYTSDDAEKRQFMMDSLPQRESLQESYHFP